MSPRSVLFALLLALGPLAGAEPLLFILGGQSNMVGHGEVVELPEADRAWPATVRLVNSKGEVEQPPLATFGPELGLARTLAAALGDRQIILAKHAVGGTSLLAWAPAWTATGAARTGNEKHGALYPALLAVARQAGLGKAEPGGVFWVQGERDAKTPPVAAEYQANLTALIAAFRRDLASPRCPFILARVNPPPDQYPALARVIGGMEAVVAADPLTLLVSTEGLSKKSDRLHYNGPGQLALGTRMAEAWLKLRATPR